jgi:hypothetical protein
MVQSDAIRFMGGITGAPDVNRPGRSFEMPFQLIMRDSA